ncbi:hypothetical protein SEA_RASPUTIA_58 [Microbacterium phage Rasputia]|nr:hypothetical protein SEA_RASPUTIA_58 [Microbacterium phage Rasputia]
MSTAIAPASTITAPTRLTAPFGAFSVLEFRETADRWFNGVQWETLTCAPAGVIDDLNCDVEEVLGLPRDLDKLPAPYGAASAFSVYGHYQCSVIGRNDHLSYAEEQARLHLATREEAALETYVEAQIRERGSVLSGLTSPWEYVAALEQFFVETAGTQGIIWTSRRLATLMADDGDLSERGGRLLTPLRTPVVAAAGVADNFIGITPGIAGYRGPIEDFSNNAYDLMDRGQNDLFAIAQRDYLVGFEDCGVAYALPTLPAVTVTPPDTTPPAE